MCLLCLEPIKNSGLDYVGVKILSQMGSENIQIGLCMAGKNNLIKNIQQGASGLESVVRLSSNFC